MEQIEKSATESLLTADELKNAVCGKLIAFAENEKKFSFTSVTIDSRNVVAGSLFVPLIGEFQDGHKYIPQAIEKGATVIFLTDFVYEQNSKFYTELISKNQNLVFVVVKNNMTALQDAARAYVKKFPKLIKVSVTGSSGKTTTKEICKTLLSQKYNVVSTVGNFNSETGLPLSVFNICEEHELGLFEMGMNRENEIAEIARVFKPNYAIITNIGNAHIGILGSRENIAKEKKNIFNFIDENGAAFIYERDDFRNFLSENVKGKIVYFGKENSFKNCGVEFIEDNGLLGTKFSLNGKIAELKLPGKYNFLNALSAIELSKVLGLSDEEILRGIELIKAPEGRSSAKEIFTKNQLSDGRAVESKKILVLEDCYNANPDSMERALEMCSSIKVDGRKILILGDMFELGESSASSHSKIGASSTVSDANVVIFVGKEMEHAAHAAKCASFNHLKYFSDLESENLEKISNLLLENLRDGDFVFVKASHGMHLEKIIESISAVEESSILNSDSNSALNKNSAELKIENSSNFCCNANLEDKNE